MFNLLTLWIVSWLICAFPRCRLGTKTTDIFTGSKTQSTDAAHTDIFSSKGFCRWETAPEIPNLEHKIDEYQHYIMWSTTVSITSQRPDSSVLFGSFSDSVHYWPLQVIMQHWSFSSRKSVLVFVPLFTQYRPPKSVLNCGGLVLNIFGGAQTNWIECRLIV